jgi:hypothetical protein
MTYPTSSSETATVFHESIEVNRCADREGLWIDMLEEEHLKASAGPGTIDTGVAKVGRSFDTVEQIACPSCPTSVGQAAAREAVARPAGLDDGAR